MSFAALPHMPKPPLPAPLPEGMAALLGQFIGALQVVAMYRRTFSPYSVAVLEAGSKELQTWLANRGPASAQQMHEMLKALHAHALNLVERQVDFRAQLHEHLDALRAKLQDATADRSMSADFSDAFLFKLELLRSASTEAHEDMARVYAQAQALDRAITKKLSVSTDGKNRIRSVGFKA